MPQLTQVNLDPPTLSLLTTETSFPVNIDWTALIVSPETINGVTGIGCTVYDDSNNIPVTGVVGADFDISGFVTQMTLNGSALRPGKTYTAIPTIQTSTGDVLQQILIIQVPR